MAYRLGKAQFSLLVEQAIAEVPPEFAAALDEVPVEIRDRPTAEQRRSVSLRRDNLLLGLYKGAPLTLRSYEAPAMTPVIYIFQEEIEAASGTEQEVREQVRKTVLHEIGHHFGLDEDDLRRLGYG